MSNARSIIARIAPPGAPDDSSPLVPHLSKPLRSTPLDAPLVRPYLLALLGGITLATAWLFPGGWWCAAFGWIAAFCFVHALLCHPHDRARRPYRLCWIYGVTAIAIAFSWLSRTIAIFSGLPGIAAMLVFCLFVVGSALQFPLTHWCAVRLPRWFHRWGLTYPLGWIAGEMISPRIFPWHLGHTQLAVRPLALSASFAGACPISFLMIWVTTTLSLAITGRRYRPLCASLFALVIAAGFGENEYVRYVMATQYEGEFHTPLSVSLVQANVSLERKHDMAFFSANIESYRSLSRELPSSTQLVVWPETVIQALIPDTIRHLSQTNRLPPPLPNQDLLLGSLTFTADEHPRNSALVLRPDGSISPAYHKQILMPFGEYTPLSDLLPWMAALNDRVANFAAGTGPVITQISSEPRAKLAPLICYEDTVPSLSREAVRAGATVLASLSNDAWFGDSAAPDQHELIAAFRAIETRRTLLRSTNTGTTGIIDPLGRSLGRLPPFSEGVLSRTVPVVHGDTPFTRLWGEWPTRVLGWGTALWALLMVALRRQSLR